MSFVTIKEAHIEANLLVAKSILESEGIQCFLKNEFSTQIMNYMPTFLVELQVDEKDVEKALGLLA